MQAGEDSFKGKILVVDDEEEIFDYVCQALAPLDYEMIYADNGTSGFLKAKQEKPELIILDITMPLMGGFETCGLLREYEETKHIPILFLSGSTIIEYKSHALRQGGAVGYLQKPINDQELLMHVRKLLKTASHYSPFEG